jgi:translation initiation factor IF-2
LRVYHLARESGLSGRILLQMLHARGIEVPSHMSVLEEVHAAVLREAVAAQKAGGGLIPGATLAPAATGAAGLRRPGVAPALGVGDKRRRPGEEEAKPVKAGTSKKRKGRDEKREELSEELLEDGIEEIIEVDPAALPGITAPAALRPGTPTPPPAPVEMPDAPIIRSAPIPAPVERLSRLEQRRAPRTLVRQKRRGRQEPTLGGKIAVPCPISVKELSQLISVRAQDIIRSLIQSGVMANINSTLEEETVQVLALEFGRDVEIKKPKPPVEQVLEGLDIEVQDEARLETRPPVVAVLGHVDHGKTSLLDAIRKTDVAAHEAGGITQHIGAYQVHTEGGRLVTFLDTPGHEAFTAMRARGANVADVVILVVAADDGVMPQTEEAISHARAAGVPIVVALNKIDKPQANRDRVLNQLSTLGLVWDKWGGDTPVESVSATKGEGVAHLVEMVALAADMQEIKADPHRRAAGAVIEASKGQERGVLATLLVQQGTLRVGDIVLAGTAYGRVRSLHTEKGEEIDEAPPSTPVRVTGLSDVPEAGASFYVLEDLSTAKQISEDRSMRSRADDRVQRPTMTLENVFHQLKDTGDNEIRVVLKADMKGSVEALEKKLEELKTDEVKVRLLHGAVGAITESDVKLAVASRAIVIGFHVLAEAAAKDLAERERIQIRTYQIIYEVVDDLKKAMEGLLEPERKEEVLGHATVKEIFAISRVGTIAGCAVSDGVIKRAGLYRLYRDGKQALTEQKLESLKRFKDDVKEVKGGFECGLKLANYDDVKVGDVLECYEVVEVKRTLK